MGLAKQLKKQADSVNDNSFLQDVLEQAQNAANEGLYSITVQGEADSNVAQKILREGFKINKVGNEEWEISWRNA